MITRRRVLAGMGALVVLGFDPTARTWIATARASSAFDRLPRLDGEVITDPASLEPYASDAGNTIHHAPVAVLFPGSVADIAKMVQFCRRHRISVGARGQGHTTFGQAQVRGGLVIDMSGLNQIHSITDKSADVGAGLKWSELVTTLVPAGLTPPVLTGYIGLSIGGTLSVGGVSSGNDRGTQVDRVCELEVVTGEGRVKRCSPFHNRELFDAMLAGLGQCGIITRAVVELVPAPAFTRVYLLNYTDNTTFFRDLRTLTRRGEFDDVYTLWLPDANGKLFYQLNTGKFFNPGEPPNDERLLRGLSVDPSSVTIQDVTYLEYALRVDVAIDFFRAIGLWDGVQHPWFDVWLPDWSVESYVGEVIPTLTPEDVGSTGFVLLFPQKRSKLTRPFLRVPGHTDWVYLFDILTAAAAPGANPEFVARMLDRNRRLFERARNLGGTRYPIGSLQFDHKDWRIQYGSKWNEFKKLKRRFDPDGILTPGPGIF